MDIFLGLEIENLLRQALVKIPLLPFSLSLEKWRWSVMEGRLRSKEYNRAWWDLKRRYLGKRIFYKTTTWIRLYVEY